MNKVVCPNCGANVSVDSSQQKIKCQFCSSEFTNPNYNDVIIIKDRKFSREEILNKGKEIIESRYKKGLISIKVATKYLKAFGWFLIVCGVMSLIVTIAGLAGYLTEFSSIGEGIAALVFVLFIIFIGFMIIKKWHISRDKKMRSSLDKKIKEQDPMTVGKKYYEKRTLSPSETIVSQDEYGDPFNLFENGKLWVIQKYVITYEDGHKEMTESRHPA